MLQECRQERCHPLGWLMNCRNYTKNNVGVGRTDVKRVEMESLVLDVINNQRNQILSKKHEAYTLQGIGSSHKNHL